MLLRCFCLCFKCLKFLHKKIKTVPIASISILLLLPEREKFLIHLGKFPILFYLFILFKITKCPDWWIHCFIFRKIWRALFSCNTCFEICPLVLLPANWQPLSTGYDFDLLTPIINISAELNTGSKVSLELIWNAFNLILSNITFNLAVFSGGIKWRRGKKKESLKRGSFWPDVKLFPLH